ncbi:uncharacterized protein LOC101893180 isoform X2 [Musca domestica]|uniref:Uncharacterized protein LOC101893180 isoform X2 n=1 Tax=Musca domestica TaxID=7370 RepID=A0A9J7ICT9_MUSDO|nr:uncharacterized protein LOC101893180 isoform X2 [Musca domestica]
MPEVVLTSIPPLEITPDNSSENETPTSSSSDTTRSNDDPASASSADIKVQRSSLAKNHKNGRPSIGSSQMKNKYRKSIPKRLSKKSAGVGVTSQPKKSVNKSQIPRSLLLTPSSSCKSLNSSVSFQSSKERGSITTQEETLTTAVLKRQKTGIILAYRQRKSISQMDMKHLCRNQENELHGKSLVAKGNGVAAMHHHHNPYYISHQETSSIVQKIYGYGQHFSGNSSQLESQTAGLRIFSIIMLNAWRKRRAEVKRLQEEITELKRCAIKARNQLHVFNSLFRMEQKRNDELSCQLKRSLEDITNAKSSCEILTTSLISLGADKELLQQQIEVKDQEIENLNSLISQANTNLFKVMTEQRELQANFSMEQRKVQSLENEKNELINKIYKLDYELCMLEAKLKLKTDEINNSTKQLDEFRRINDYNEQLLSKADGKEQALNEEIEKLQKQIAHLEEGLNKSWGTRFKCFFYRSLTYPRTTLHILHWFIYYLLPATPPPKLHTFPFLGFSTAKVLNIVRHQ